MSQIPAKRAQANSDARTPTWVNRKKIYICLKFSLKMFIMLHIPEALRHTVMPGLQPGRTRKRYTTFALNLSQNVHYVAYPRSAQAYGDARTPAWLNQKKIYNICLKFVLKCLLCCISQKRSGIRWQQDSYLAEPEKDIQRLSKIMSNIPEALRHTLMPGFQHGWTRKGIQMRVSTQLYYF